MNAPISPRAIAAAWRPRAKASSRRSFPLREQTPTNRSLRCRSLVGSFAGTVRSNHARAGSRTDGGAVGRLLDPATAELSMVVNGRVHNLLVPCYQGNSNRIGLAPSQNLNGNTFVYEDIPDPINQRSSRWHTLVPIPFQTISPDAHSRIRHRHGLLQCKGSSSHQSLAQPGAES